MVAILFANRADETIIVRRHDVKKLYYNILLFVSVSIYIHTYTTVSRSSNLRRKDTHSVMTKQLYMYTSISLKSIVNAKRRKRST